MPVLTIKIPLFEPTNTKLDMYNTMQQRFSEACNQGLQLKRDEPKRKASEIDRLLGHIVLPSTLVQEARKLAVSRFQDWRKHVKNKGFPSFKRKLSIPFNNQNWRFRFDNGFLKLGIPTTEGSLTMDKYVPLQTNDYSMFWVTYLMTGEMDKHSQYYREHFERVSKPKERKWTAVLQKGQMVLLVCRLLRPSERGSE